MTNQSLLKSNTALPLPPEQQPDTTFDDGKSAKPKEGINQRTQENPKEAVKKNMAASKKKKTMNKAENDGCDYIL